MSVSGSVRKVLLNGLSFNAAADANPARQPTQENEGIRHSGGVSKKVTLMPGAVEALKLIVTDTEYEILQGLSEQTTNFPMSYEKANGTVLRANGFINLDNYEAEENSVEITMTPETGSWETFAA
jgi:hypothetical protein